jgi:hypothetical protein
MNKLVVDHASSEQNPWRGKKFGRPAKYHQVADGQEFNRIEHVDGRYGF